MAQDVTIVGEDGRPLSIAPRSRARADGAPGTPGWNWGALQAPGGSSAFFPYDASLPASQEMGNWWPVIRSPDSEINWFRDRVVGRTRDLVRNSGWASGGIARILDSTIGTQLRLSAMPDYRALAQQTGITAFDAKWANEYRRAVESLYRGYAEHPGRWNDLERSLTVGQQQRLALRHKLIDGDGLSLAYWRPDRVGPGAATFATCFQIVDPDRLCNPLMQMDTKYLRGGVEIDDDGVRVAAHIRKAEPYDWYNALESNEWERVEFEDPDGWRRVYLDFDIDRAGQHRGLSIFVPVLTHMRMLARYYGVELQAATLAATFGTYVTSPYDPAQVEEAIGGIEDAELSAYQKLRAAWSKEKPAMFGGVRMPTLAPGESIESVASQHPHGNFGEFAHEMLCVFAAATGVSVEQVTQDWSKTSYSSARAALMETWKTLMRRRGDFCTNTATPWYATWLWEVHDRGMLKDVLPRNAPKYVEAAAAYARADWLGPGRGYIDGQKEPLGAQLRMDTAVSTLRDEAAEQGADWEEQLDQRQIEIEGFRERNIPLPSWSNEEAAKTDEETGSHDPDSPNYKSGGRTE